LNAQIDAGAEAVQIFDSWAGIVPDNEFDRLVIEPVQRIVAGIRKAHPDVPIIGFPRGIGKNYPRYFRETGIDALSIDSSVSLAVAAQELQPIGPVQGNLDPSMLLAGGTAMDEAVKDILDTLGKGPFVFNLGHGVVPPTPVEHVARLAELIRAHG
jgi:uroporphyrinogen decarboxylase